MWKYTVPEEQKSEIPNYDLVLFVSVAYSDDNWLARAGPCKLDGTTNRTTCKTMNNLNHLIGTKVKVMQSQMVNGKCNRKKNFVQSMDKIDWMDGCSPDLTGLATCITQDFLAPDCGYQEALNTDCRYNSSTMDFATDLTGGYVCPGSRCVKTTLPNLFRFQTLPTDCFQAICQDNQIQFQVRQKLKDRMLKCSIILEKQLYQAQTINILFY